MVVMRVTPSLWPGTCCPGREKVGPSFQEAPSPEWDFVVTEVGSGCPGDLVREPVSSLWERMAGSPGGNVVLELPCVR